PSLARLPDAASLQALSAAFAGALALGEPTPVRRAGQELLSSLADFYQVPAPKLKVLGSRPHALIEGHLSYELFGDYSPDTDIIRAWMRTAVHGRVTSYRGLLNTL